MGLETATAFRADGQYQYGFKTGGARIETGGDFTGTKTGVRATGTETGVYAVGSNTLGVYGEIIENGTGVYGLASKPGGIGIAGLSKGSTGTAPNGDPVKVTESSTGIVGATETGHGFGIVGLSIEDMPTAPAKPWATIDQQGKLKFSGPLGFGIGVLGASRYGTAVQGVSKQGVGVEGKSESGRGGKFSSDEGAQINLVPAKLNYPPAKGQAGDLIVLGNYDPRTGTGLEPQLWLCVLDGNSDNPALWKQVMLGNEVKGQG